MLRSTTLFLAFVALTSAACAAPATGEGSASSANAISTSSSPKSDFVAQLDACDAATNAKDCIASAIDGAVPTIAANGASGVADAIAQARLDDDMLCSELAKAGVSRDQCDADRERTLASIVRSMVKFGTTPTHSFEQDRAGHEACYAGYDAEQNIHHELQDLVDKLETLVECIANELPSVTAPVAAAEVQKDASAGPLEVATTRVTAAFQAKIKTGGALCAVLRGATGLHELPAPATYSDTMVADCRRGVIEDAYSVAAALAGR